MNISVIIICSVTSETSPVIAFTTTKKERIDD